MSLDTEYEDEENPDEDPEGQQGPKGLRKRLSKVEQELAEERTARSQTARENAFLKAGLPDNPQTRFLQAHYDGEPTVEAVKAAAIEHGFASSEQEVPDDELAAHDRVSAASAGAGAADARSPGIGSPEYQAELAKTTNQDEALQVMRKYGAVIAE